MFRLEYFEKVIFKQSKCRPDIKLEIQSGHLRPTHFELRCRREMDQIVSVGLIVRFSLQPLGCGSLHFWLLCELLGIGLV